MPLYLEALEDRTLLSGGRSFDSATPVPMNPSGTLAAGQADYYQYQATFTGELTVRQSADPSSNSTLDSLLSVYDGSSPQPRLLTSNDDLPDNGTLQTDNNSGNNFSNAVANLDSLVHVPVVMGQKYFIVAGVSPGAASANASGAYVLALGQHAGGTTFADAQSIALDSTNAGGASGTLAVSGDVDTYQFTAQATGGVTIGQAAANGGPLDSTLVIFDSTGRQIAFNDDIGSGNLDSQVQIAVAAGQTYYVEAAASPYAAPGTDTGDYQLSISPVADDVANNLADAQLVTMDNTGAAVQQGSIDYPGDVDAFRFQATVTGRLTVQQQAASGSSLDSFLTAYDSAGRPITFNDDNGATGHSLDSQVTFDVVAGRTYYLRAGASPAADTSTLTGGYQLTFRTDAQAAPADRGHVFADPLALTPDASGEDRRLGNIAAPGQNDVYRLTATQTGPLVVRQEALTGGTGLRSLIYVFDGSHRLLGFSFDTGGHRSFFVYHHAGPDNAGLYDYHDNSAEELPRSAGAPDFDFAQVQFDAVAGQTYYVVATGFEESEGQYALTVQNAEQGNVLADAQPLAMDATGAGSAFGTISVPSGRQTYAFTAPVTGQFIVQDLATSGSPLDTTLTAYDGSGRQIKFDDDLSSSSTNSQVELKLIAGQTYYLAAAGYGMKTGSYRLTITPAVPDGFGTNFASATDLTGSLDAGDSGGVTGALIVPGGSDYFQFTAPATGGLTVRETATPGSTLDTYLTVYDSNQQLLTFNDDGGGGLDSLVRLNVTAGQTYYLQAGSFGDSIGAYQLTLAGGSVIADGFGHALDDTRPISLDASGAGFVDGAIVNAGDEDYFQFTAAATGLLSITQNAASGSPLDSVLTVYNSGRSQVAFNDDVNYPTDLNSAVEFSVTGGHTYTIRAAGYGTSTGAYRITLTPIVPDNYGTDFATATAITPSLSAAGSGQVAGVVESPGSVDFLQFTAPATGQLTIEQDAAAGSSLDSTLTVLDSTPQHNQIAFNDDIASGNLNSRVRINAVAGQTYFIEAAGYGDSTGAYTLTFTTGAPAGGSPAAGTTLDTATPVTLAPSGPTTLQGTIASAGDTHFYRFTAPADGHLTAEQDAAPGSMLDSYLYVYDGAGNQIASDDDSAGNLNSLAEFPVAAGQTYTVEAAAYGSSTGAYVLTLAGADSRLAHTFADATDLLPLSDPATAGAAGFADTTGTIAAPGDSNFFRFTAPFSGGVEIRQQALPGSRLATYLFAYDSTSAPDGTPQHNLLAHDGGHGAASTIRLAVQEGQTYFVQAAGAADTTGDYALSLTPVPDDFGNDFNNAEPLQLDATDAGSQAGTVEVPGDVDVFRFVAPSSGTLTVTLGPAGDSALVPVLSAFDGSQQPVALQAGSTAGQSVQVQFPVDAGQTYYVQAGGLGASTGDYTLGFHDPVGVAATGPHDFASARPVALSFGPDGTATVPVVGSLDPGEVQFFRFRAEQAGRLAVAVTGVSAAVDVFTFPDGFQAPAEQLTGEHQGTFAVRARQTYYVRVTSREVSLPAPGGYGLTFTREEAPGDGVDSRVGNTTAGDLRHAFSIRIRGDADPQQTADAISASLVQTFLAGVGGHVTTNYLLLWLDPVDFVLTDPQGRQAGNTPDRVRVNEVPGSFYSNGGSANVLQLLILPDALASQFSLNLIGVGDGQVLAGARLITPNGTVSPSTSLVFGTQPGASLERVLDFSPQPPALVTTVSQGTAVAVAGPGNGPAAGAPTPPAAQPLSLPKAVAAMLLNATVTTVTSGVIVNLPGPAAGKATAASPTGGAPAPGPAGQSGTAAEDGAGGLAALFGVVDRYFSGPVQSVAAEVSAGASAFTVPGSGVAEGTARAVAAALAPVQGATAPVRDLVLRLADGVWAPAAAEVKLLTQVLRARLAGGKSQAHLPAPAGKAAVLPAGRADRSGDNGGMLQPSLAAVVFLSGAWCARPAEDERKKADGRR